MWELVQTGGWLMWPILLASVLATAIVAERFWSLRGSRVAPASLLSQVCEWQRNGQLNTARLQEIRRNSPLGRMFAAGIANQHNPRDVMKEAIEEVGRHEVHLLERYLNTLGSIASTTPLLGLLGTVVGMIKVFDAITLQGVGDPGVLSAGISEALITTAAGLSVAIPSFIFYRHLRRRVDALVVDMEQEAIKLVEIIHGDREM
ncbi:MAG: MotA/TolQ/ExbB proton channel family protein [Gammaproteobacteria bacterium]|jgi:biopolymer transport protein ExbB